MEECDRLGDKPTLFPDGKIAALEDSNLSDWQNESEIPSGSMLLLSSVNRYLEMEGLGLEEDQEEQQIGEDLQDGGYEDMENLEGEEELETSQVGMQEEDVVDLNKSDSLNNSMAKERPRRIHVPEHWKDYPLVIEGAIADSIIHCQLSSPKLKKLTKAIKDIITTNISFPVAGKTHNLAFTTVQTYFHRTRARLCRVLGERCLPAGVQRLITPTTTYSRLLNDVEQINKPSNASPLLPIREPSFRMIMLAIKGTLYP
uniref:Uncharacterized protein n=1 Tax=Ditylenchus dipsaci TaxID=166011 RepID=A0A915D1Q9_9BILA